MTEAEVAEPMEEVEEAEEVREIGEGAAEVECGEIGPAVEDSMVLKEGLRDERGETPPDDDNDDD